MRYEFTEQDIIDEANKIELDGEDVTLIGKYIENVESEENTYIIAGDAVVDGELYHDFVTMFETLQAVENPSARTLANSDWDWFDYVCD